MNIEILSRSVVPTPTLGHAFLFFDSGNNNALTAKFACGDFKVLSEGITPHTINQSLLDAQNDILNNISCAVAKGVVSMADYLLLLNAFNLYYTYTIDENGNVVESITTTPPSAPPPAPLNDGFVINSFSYGNDTLTISSTTFTNEAALSRDFFVSVDRNGYQGNLTVSLTGLPLGISIALYSFSVSSLGVITTSALNTIVSDTSYIVGDLIYDGTTIAPGIYTGLIEVTNGTVTRYKVMSIVIS